MAEYINKTDTLNEGRVKLNAAIGDAESAKATAKGADVKSTQALANSESTQTQLDTIVIEGDSSVEAAQARVDELGEGHATLKARIDDGFERTSSQLAHNVEISENKKIQSAERLFIETFDGTNQPYHPTVQYFKNGWNGRKWWKVHTPFPSGVPPYIDRWECPSIVSSDDGITWSTPPNAPYPLLDLTEGEIARKDFYSDPDTLMNNNTMEIWYRKTNGATRATNIYRILTEDGETFSVPEKVFDFNDSNNGFPAKTSMRSHQVFLSGNKYISFFSLQGGQGIWRAESNNPSTGRWDNLIRLNFSGHTHLDVSLWHIGMANVGNTYHMTAYDSKNNAIQYFTSSDGLNFTFKSTLLKAYERMTDSIYSLYQSYPVFADDKWFLFAGGTFVEGDSTRQGISLFGGARLETISPIKSSWEIKGKTFNSGVRLANKAQDNSLNQLAYLTFSDAKNRADSFIGYRMMFGSVTSAPAWLEKGRTRPIMYVFDDTSNPYYKPDHIGIVLRNVNSNNDMWISTDKNDKNDWKKILFEGDPNSSKIIKDKRINVLAQGAIDTQDAHIIVINQGEAETVVENLEGVSDGREVYLLNTLNRIHLKDMASGEGSFRFHDGDRTLERSEGISLIGLGGSWYVK